MEYDRQLEVILEKHAPVNVKLVQTRAKKVAWFDNKAKQLQSETRKLEKLWKKIKKSRRFEQIQMHTSDLSEIFRTATLLLH